MKSTDTVIAEIRGNLDSGWRQSKLLEALRERDARISRLEDFAAKVTIAKVGFALKCEAERVLKG
jgi:hypothetical protein